MLRCRAASGRFIRCRSGSRLSGVGGDPRRAKYEEQVRHPGKFEGENPWVPYFWEQYLDGGADDDDGRVLTFRVSADDVRLFPELARRKRVRLMERDDGFVVEV